MMLGITQAACMAVGVLQHLSLFGIVVSTCDWRHGWSRFNPQWWMQVFHSHICACTHYHTHIHTCACMLAQQFTYTHTHIGARKGIEDL